MILLLLIAIILGNPITVILILFAMYADASAADWKCSERQKERRHNEAMKLQKERLEVAKRKKSASSQRRVRTMLRDERGRFIAQEIIEDIDDFDDHDDLEDFD